MISDTTFGKYALRTALAAACGLLLAGAAAAAVTVSVAPSAKSVLVGQSFSLDLVADGASDGIGAWDFVLALSQPGTVSLSGIAFSDALGSIGSEALSFSSTDFGVVSLLSSAELLLRQQAQPFTLATLTFSAVTPGTTDVSLIKPQFGEMIADAAGLAVIPTVLPGTITVSAVPEPASWLLLLSGAGLIGAWRKRASA